MEKRTSSAHKRKREKDRESQRRMSATSNAARETNRVGNAEVSWSLFACFILFMPNYLLCCILTIVWAIVVAVLLFVCFFNNMRRREHSIGTYWGHVMLIVPPL